MKIVCIYVYEFYTNLLLSICIHLCSFVRIFACLYLYLYSVKTTLYSVKKDLYSGAKSLFPDIFFSWHFFRKKCHLYVGAMSVYLCLHSIEKALYSVTNNLHSGARALHSGMSSGKQTFLKMASKYLYMCIYVISKNVHLFSIENPIFSQKRSPMFCSATKVLYSDVAKETYSDVAKETYSDVQKKRTPTCKRNVQKKRLYSDVQKKFLLQRRSTGQMHTNTSVVYGIYGSLYVYL